MPAIIRRRRGVFGDGEAAVQTPDAFSSCPVGACGYDFVTAFQDMPPSSAARSLKLTNGEWRNYSNGSLALKSIFVPAGWRVYVLYMMSIENAWRGQAGGYIRLVQVDGPQLYPIDTEFSTATYQGPGLTNGLSINWATGVVENFPRIEGSITIGANQPSVAHVVAWDMRSEAMKAAQKAEMDRRVQVISLETESKLATQEANFAEQLADATKRAAAALEIAQANQGRREEIRGQYTESQTALAAQQTSNLIQATSTARLESSRAVDEAIAKQSAQIQAQYATPIYKNPIAIAVAVALALAAIIKFRK